MRYVVSADHNGMAVHLTRNDWRVLRSAVYPMQWMGMMISCRMAEDRYEFSARKMKELTVKVETRNTI